MTTRTGMQLGAHRKLSITPWVFAVTIAAALLAGTTAGVAVASRLESTTGAAVSAGLA